VRIGVTTSNQYDQCFDRLLEQDRIERGLEVVDIYGLVNYLERHKDKLTTQTFRVYRNAVVHRYKVHGLYAQATQVATIKKRSNIRIKRTAVAAVGRSRKMIYVVQSDYEKVLCYLEAHRQKSENSRNLLPMLELVLASGLSPKELAFSRIEVINGVNKLVVKAADGRQRYACIFTSYIKSSSPEDLYNLLETLNNKVGVDRVMAKDLDKLLARLRAHLRSVQQDRISIRKDRIFCFQSISDQFLINMYRAGMSSTDLASQIGRSSATISKKLNERSRYQAFE